MQYDLTDMEVLRRLLARQGFTFSKALGQNFITDPTVCPRMVSESGIGDADGVLEIGPGVGVLTTELAKRANKVVSLEVDARLLPVLAKTLDEFRNTEVLNADVMKTDLGALLRTHFAPGQRVFVCANLPYYITSPVITGLLESGLPFAGYTLMVQKEAAERLCAKMGTRQCGAVTALVDYYTEAEILFDVKKESFTPPPKVESAVIRLTPRPAPPVEVSDPQQFFKTVRAAFGHRRKTAANALSQSLGISREKAIEALRQAGLAETARAEEITMEQFAALSAALFGN